MYVARLKTQSYITRQGPDIRPQLQSQGYGLIKASEFILSPGLPVHFQALQDACQDLPKDEYDPFGCRYRRLARFLYKPWNDRLELLPYWPYKQAAKFAPVSGDVQRQLAPLGVRESKNPFLRALIRFDYGQLPIPPDVRQLPWLVGVHPIKVIATPEQPGVSSPNRLHKDSEPFGCIHLINRKNVTGGLSIVASNDGVVLCETVLSHPLDTLIYVDEAVFHDVREIYVCPGYAQGERHVLLVDFAPLLPQETGSSNLL